MRITRRAARAILLDDEGQLLLLRRTKRGQRPYWTTPGGGVEPGDASIEAAMHRELMEELGATATSVYQAFVNSVTEPAGVSVQYFFLARLRSIDPSARCGPELQEPSRGGYALERVTWEGLATLDLKPAVFKRFAWANRVVLAADAAAVVV